MRLIGLHKTEFYDFLKEENNGFPKAVVVGTKATRKRWKKAQILAYIDLLGS